MKLRMTLSIALVLSIVLVSLMSSDSTAKAQQPQRYRFATGVVTPGPDQTLRVMEDPDSPRSSTDPRRVRFIWTQYMEASCSGVPAVCRHSVASRGATPVAMLGNDDALSFDVQGNGKGVSVAVESNCRDLKVLGIVFDTSTQRIVDVMVLERTSLD